MLQGCGWGLLSLRKASGEGPALLRLDSQPQLTTNTMQHTPAKADAVQPHHMLIPMREHARTHPSQRTHTHNVTSPIPQPPCPPQTPTPSMVHLHF